MLIKNFEYVNTTSHGEKIYMNHYFSIYFTVSYNKMLIMTKAMPFQLWRTILSMCVTKKQFKMEDLWHSYRKVILVVEIYIHRRSFISSYSSNYIWLDHCISKTHNKVNALIAKSIFFINLIEVVSNYAWEYLVSSTILYLWLNFLIRLKADLKWLKINRNK